MDHAVLILKRAFNQQKSAACDRDAVLLEGIGGKDDVGYSGLVFKGEESKTLGCARPLPGDHTAGDADRLIAVPVGKLLRRQDAFLPQRLAVVSHGVRACCKARTGIVGGKTLVGGHLLQGRLGVCR